MIRPENPELSDPVSDLLARVAEVLPVGLVGLLDARAPELARSMAAAVRREMPGAGQGEDVETAILGELRIAIAAVRDRRALTAEELEQLRGRGRELARRGLGVADVLAFTHATAIAGWEAARAVLAAEPGFEPAKLAELAGPLMRFVEASSVEVAATHAAESERLLDARRSQIQAFAESAFTGGAMEAELRRQARALGIVVAPRYAVCAMLVEGRQVVPPAPPLARLDLMAGPGAISVERPRARLIALPVADEGSLLRLRGLARDAVEHRGFDVVGISGAVDGLGGLPGAAAEAMSTAQLLQRVGRHRSVAAFDELLTEHMLLGDRALLERLVESVLGEVRRARSAEELLRTLTVHLANEGNVARTAVALGVHRHTVEYRLERVRSLLGAELSLASPSVVLALLGHGLLEQLSPITDERGGEAAPRVVDGG